MNNFLPEGYETPVSESRYMKFEKGDNRFRILSSPIIGWVGWKDKKPARHKTEEGFKGIILDNPYRHFWAMKVWNFKTNRIEVLEITQKGLMSGIESLSKNPDWGSPLGSIDKEGYALKVSRSGDGLETKYVLEPVPHSKITEEMALEIESVLVNLDALWDGGDPFEVETSKENEPLF